MSAAANAMPESPAPAAARAVRPFYWSVRREIWESRSIYVAPLAAAGVVMFGFAISAIRLPHVMRGLADIDPAEQAAKLAEPYAVAAMVVMATTALVAIFYCLGALSGERRDRSILFWKSLPVSDLTTVLAKAAVPLLVLPLVCFGVIIALQLSMLIVGTLALLIGGFNPLILPTEVPFLRMTVVLFYGLGVLALWNAPIYAWLLLVSAWAKRAAFLWAVLPPAALCVVEHLALRRSYFGKFLLHRLSGGFTAGFVAPEGDHGAISHLPELDPIGFLGTPGLWVGLAIAVAFLGIAVWLRRRREPI